MSVTPINNQPIRFRDVNSLDESCDCIGQRFCQIINKNDATQFQLKSTNKITNGDFESNLDGWSVFERILLEVTLIVNATEAECDGQITVSATGGTGPYTYSVDGGVFGSSSFTGLCAGNHTVVAKDSLGNEGSIIVGVDTNINCGDYVGSELNDTKDLYLSQILNCELNDFN